MRTFITGLEPLGQAAQAFVALQQPPVADARGHLRSLVTYTFGVEPPGPLTRSAQLFPGSEEAEKCWRIRSPRRCCASR